LSEAHTYGHLAAGPNNDIPGTYSAALPLLALATRQVEEASVEAAFRILLMFPDTPRLRALRLTFAIQYSWLLGDDTIAEACPATQFAPADIDDLDHLIAYMRLVVERPQAFAERTVWTPTIDASDPIVERYPAKVLELLLLLQKAGAHQPNLLISVISRLDLAQMSYEAPLLVVATLEYLAWHRREVPRWLATNFTKVVKGLSPQASRMLAPDAVETVQEFLKLVGSKRGSGA